MSSYTPIIGMEIHVELATKSKMFCGCDATHFQVTPNTHTCPVCLGLPGALPVPNAQAIDDTIKIGLALNCQINDHSKFDRKHYFYPDLPKGYQISQYDQPLCYEGSVILSTGRKIRITRVHLEEDTGKLVHQTVDGNKVSLVDFNRSGVPLVEIVTEPDFNTSAEVKEFLKLIHSTVRFLGVSDADMEKGSMRLEANISVSQDGLLPNYKTEVKNVNSFNYIATAIDYEISRQTEILQSGQTPLQETRGWSLDGRKTVSQRIKETAKDYRYFPEPDMSPLEIDAAKVAHLQANLPLLPQHFLDHLTALKVRDDYGRVAIDNQDLAVYLLELANLAAQNKLDPDQAVGQIVNKKIDWQKNSPKQVIDLLLTQSQKVALDESTTQAIIVKVIDQNPKVVADYKGGKETAIQFLLGQVMAQSRGQADPKLTIDLLKQTLAKL